MRTRRIEIMQMNLLRFPFVGHRLFYSSCLWNYMIAEIHLLHILENNWIIQKQIYLLNYQNFYYIYFPLLLIISHLLYIKALFIIVESASAIKIVDLISFEYFIFEAVVNIESSSNWNIHQLLYSTYFPFSKLEIWRIQI